MKSREFWELYSGKRTVIGEALINHDAFDQFAWCQEWRFAIADYLTFELGEFVPDFHPASEPDRESYPFELLTGMEPDRESLFYAFEILSRFREWLRIAEMDY